eukprot:2597157-Ditylum_brightwellii.AAC.1
MAGNKDCIVLSKGNKKVVIDIKIPTTNGLISAMYHQQDMELNAATNNKGTMMTLLKAHRLLGHGNINHTH